VYFLDSAELLDPAAAAALRSALTRIYQKVPETGDASNRISVVIGSRRDEEWKGYGPGGDSPLLFTQLMLTEFAETIVRQALEELRRNFGPTRLNSWATALHGLSEGLPALLVEGLRWAQNTAFLRLDDCGKRSTFDTVARPYIREDLLATESLLPLGGDNLPARKAVLERALRAIAPYRIFTQSHLRYHIEQDPSFGQALEAIGWSVAELWLAMSNTALLHRQTEEIWHALSPPIRRLLYHYYYPETAVRLAVHATARQFYEKWAAALTGFEQAVVLIECLWHEAKAIREQGSPLPARLPAIAVELTQSFMRHDTYTASEFSDFVIRRLRNDKEFFHLLREDRGLFDEILASIGRTISGGA
jgi:hypothetical protein